MKTDIFHSKKPFTTESGKTIAGLELAYCTSGTYFPGKSKVVWVCHALTASADCADWWPDLIGTGKAIDPEEYFIVCMNIPSSCYGSSGPMSKNPETNAPYFGEFPVFTIRDIVKATILLREHLGIEKIHLLIGGSMGGYQCVEWAVMENDRIENLALVATAARESAWGIAIHTSQRLAIETDPTFGEKNENAGAKGLKTARAIGMLTYRNYRAFVNTQTDEDDRIDNFRSESYIHYQGEKLVKRFNAYSYFLLTKSMDSHNVARGRGAMEDVLKKIKAKTICIGISSDNLCPVNEQQFLAEHISHAKFVEIDSPFGHDGFLVEGEKIGCIIKDFLG
ncbi:MAG TPA: homoserine O-acetyltransferase [Bacteroidia bacterium]|nr:homoserine O-acetyltransferase [Bacteroidia bacterium]